MRRSGWIKDALSQSVVLQSCAVLQAVQNKLVLVTVCSPHKMSVDDPDGWVYPHIILVSCEETVKVAS